MAEQDIPPPTITAMKIPIIRKGEYDIWSMKMCQYICHTDHNLRDVIVNGDLEEEPAPTTGETSAPPAPKTAKQLAAREIRKSLKAILFGGNVESKKMQKNIALIMRNKPDIDEIDIDDLYNNLRVYENELKSTASEDFEVAMLTVREKKFIQRTGRNMDFKEKQHVSLDKSKIECYNYHRKGNFAREITVAQDGLGGYDWSNDFKVEPANYALMAISSSSSSSSSDSELCDLGYYETRLCHGILQLFRRLLLQRAGVFSYFRHSSPAHDGEILPGGDATTFSSKTSGRYIFRRVGIAVTGFMLAAFLEIMLSFQILSYHRSEERESGESLVYEECEKIDYKTSQGIGEQHSLYRWCVQSTSDAATLSVGMNGGDTVYKWSLKSAFLYGTIEEEVYVHQPPGFIDPTHPNKVYKVIKALYGLHQALRAWFETLSSFLLENGFRRGTIDKTLFIKKNKSDIMLVQVYVDDIIFGSTKKSMYTEFEEVMHKRFQMSSMGELTFFLGLKMQKATIMAISTFYYEAEYVAGLIAMASTSLRHALTHNPTIYDSLVKQLWQTATVRTLANGTQQLIASIDSKEYTITEASVRSKLQLADATGIHNLSDAKIYVGLAILGYVTERDFVPLLSAMLAGAAVNPGEGSAQPAETTSHTMF
ncbi:putative ribonuclease H-like domain-containing protein [Tanacetum coccineum]